MKKLLQNTFQNSYSHETFVEFCAEFFQKSPRDFEFQKVFPENEEEKYSDTRHLLSFETDDKKRIEVLAVELKRKSNVENARSYQRALMEKYIKNRIHQGKWVDGVFVAFYVTEESSWRLSFVHMELKEGKQEFSPPKRHSFLVGEGESTHTAQQQIAEVLKHKKTPLFSQVLEAFSVEKVTKDFYENIQNAFFALSGGNLNSEKNKGYTEKKLKEIEAFCEKVGAKTHRTNKELQIQGILMLPHKNPETHHKDFQDFAVRLFGRLVFCWFLKKKKFETSQKPLISEKILSKKAVEENQNYYHTILEPLFFETLNAENPRKYDFPEPLKEDFDQIPFLNGGLFQNHAEDFYVKDNTAKLSLYHAPQIPDIWFQNFFEILERYNFTIDENSQLETEVSIDPEILGRIFENLLAEINPETGESARKSSGSFYTPREIVDYMVEESLLEYLRGKFPERKQFSEKEFFSFVSDSSGLSEFLKKHPSQKLSLKTLYFEDMNFETLEISPRILKKLRGDFGNNAHSEITSEIWKSFLTGNIKIQERFFGKPKIVNLKEPNGKRKKEYHWPSLGFSFVHEGKLFGAFFTPFLDGRYQLNTLFRIDERRQKKYLKDHQNILAEVFKTTFQDWDTQKETSRRDADLPHTPPKGLAAQRFSALREVLSPLNVSDEELRVKFGGASALWNEVENIVSGTAEETEDKAKEKILEAIDELKILDPACGSGAFPMGILQKIVHILEKVDPENKLWLEKLRSKNPQEYEKIKDKEPEYQRKLMIIQKSIFGVDIQEMAVEISRLRFFLSLVVEEKAEAIEPLPNLDFKFVAANSLIPLPDISGNGGNIKNAVQEELFFGKNREEIFADMENIREKYFVSHSGKKALQDDFLDKKNELLNFAVGDSQSAKYAQKLYSWKPFENHSAPFFDPKWMFGVKDGFDIVIGNPPYIQIQKFARTQTQKDLANAHFETFEKTGDIYALFYEKGLEISKPKTGILCYITSNKWIRSGYGKSLRGYFAKKNPLQLLDFGGFKVFESATVDTNILLIQNSGGAYCNTPLHACHFQNDYKKGDDLGSYFQKNCVEMKNLSAESWFIGSSAEIALKAKIEKMGKPLKEWDVKINYGIKTGLNEAFIIDQKKRDELVAKDPKSAEIIKPILRGRDIKRYGYEFANLYVIGTFPSLKLNIDDYPSIKQYLLDFGKEQLEQSGKDLGNGKKSRKKTGNKWFETQDQIGYYQEFEKEKVVWIELVDNGRFAFVESGIYTEATTFLMTFKKPKFLAGILNSRIVNWYFDKICGESGVGTNRWKKFYVEQIPFPFIIPQNQQTVEKIENLVEEILEVKNTGDACRDAINRVSTEHLEREIDILVFKLYDLTEEEIKVVSPDLVLSEEEREVLGF